MVNRAENARCPCRMAVVVAPTAQDRVEQLQAVLKSGLKSGAPKQDLDLLAEAMASVLGNHRRGDQPPMPGVRFDANVMTEETERSRDGRNQGLRF